MRVTIGVLFAAALLGCLTGCSGGGSSASPGAGTDTSTASVTSASTTPQAATASQATTPAATATVAKTVAGDPIAGLSAAELLRFTNGKTGFSQDESSESDFGPLFNGTSCVQCHGIPAPGGGSAQLVTRFGKNTAGVFDPLTAEGGSLQQAHAIPGKPLEVVPADANVIAQRRSTPLMGLGLVEAIPDSAIVTNANAEQANNPGQAGQVNFVTSAGDGKLHVGRFGWKCQQALLLDFAADAYANEMGVSSALFPFENVANAAPTSIPLAQVEDQPDSTGIRDIDRFADFMRFLAPPPVGIAVPAGERVFHNIGCAVCHTPSFPTSSSVNALNGQLVSAYSDFLLHDVGTGDGIVQGNAPANMLRTAPLMGVSQQPALLHNGSAPTIDAAILAHAGQANGAKQAFQRLSPGDQQSLRDFIKSL